MQFHVRVRTSSPVFPLVLGPFLLGSSLIGCGSPVPDAAPSSAPASSAPVAASPAAAAPASDPDDVPIKESDVARPADYSEAIRRIEGYRDTIRDEIAAGRPTKAHRGLDELDIVLNWLPEIARDAGVPKDHWEKVNLTAKAIQDLFNQVHSRIDDKKEPDYGSVSARIDAAIGELKKIPPGTKTPEPEKKP